MFNLVGKTNFLLIILGVYSCRTVNSSGSATLSSENEDKKPIVEDWIPIPTQAEINDLLAGKNPDEKYKYYADYARCEDKPEVCDRGAFAIKSQLPGKAILAAMRANIPTDPPTSETYRDYINARAACLKTNFNPHHWNDLQLVYYCSFSTEEQTDVRFCYTGALAILKLSRADSFQVCSGEQDVADRKVMFRSREFDAVQKSFVELVKNRKQSELFQYIMFASTWAFDEGQAQAIINEYYGVTDANSEENCALRPRRSEDLENNKHCLPGKGYQPGELGVYPIGR